MSRRIVVAAIVAATVTLLPATMAPALADSGSAATPPTTLVDNAFLPEDANLSDCVSSLPQPDCGSEARGGWRQTLLFLTLAGGLGVIGWRIIAGMRRGRHGEEAAP